ncbi:MAG: AMP-binding protein [bacterium]|nr:acid--CoA ligase [Deltaproteobacteria bacterium]MCP4903839.1 AMP-binding protein [bacterium]
MTRQSYGRALGETAALDPDRRAVVCEGDSISVGELDLRSNRLARAYAERGVKEGDRVSFCLPNGIELITGCFAAWKLGAVPSPLSDRLPGPERDAILSVAAPALVVGIEADVRPEMASVPRGFQPDAQLSAEPLPDRTAPHERALASGGSTGIPKLIIPKSEAAYDRENASPLFKAKRAVLVPGPLSHAVPFSATFQGILAGCEVVVMGRFDASRFLELIEAHRVDRVSVVPTMMLRIWRLPVEERLARDVSSLEFVMSGGAPLPAWLMRAWIEWLGPEVMHEAFGPSERIGGTFINGTEWLAHPGSVGRSTTAGGIRILDAERNELPAGEMGEIFMMPTAGPGSTYQYVGAKANASHEGWESVGDMGYLDADGYLYLGDRRTDMILSGGRNVYPAEIEAALVEHPSVRSCAVIGLPDEEFGQRIHAVVESEGDLDEEALRDHLEARLVRYKIPRSFEAVGESLRNEAGKVRRSALRSARL